jgi:hypothetical protein
MILPGQQPGPSKLDEPLLAICAARQLVQRGSMVPGSVFHAAMNGYPV